MEKPFTKASPNRSTSRGWSKDIRKQGFDVLLMLEATIGLNELAEQQPAGTVESSKAKGAEAADGDRTFTPQDVHFLRSLRIAIEGEEDGPSDE